MKRTTVPDLHSTEPGRSWRRVACAALLLAGVAGCSKETATGPPKQSVTPVLVAEVVRKDMPVTLRAIGRVSPIQTVTLKPQVTGRIAEVHFKDGQDVKKGDVLFTIERKPFEVALGEAKALLAQATAQAGNAKDQERRYQTLSKDGAVPQKELELATVNVKSASSQTAVAEATVQKAEMNLAYCDVRAPIPGRAGRVLADVGNVASAYQTDLVVINQIEPIEVTFAVPEQQLPALQRGMNAGALKVTANTSLPERLTVEGQLEFLDNTVKPNTGTIDVRATFKNTPQILWPGQYANLGVEVKVDKNAVVAPARAVQPGQNGTFVFMVLPDMTVRAMNVVVARMVENEAVISSGLEGGEKVVIDGHDRLRDGGKVSIKPGLEGSPSPDATAGVIP
ncbi:efflux RND transporter periplasmic adaptor subunit [Prosthecobacter sp.]|uniref:efflux RND transporter periplasmic adaptor subunit n=1 Tax=Prosthecobacter sp. TaxID=1965333 RepID=UPI002ABBAD44|nr:efflux RND transporter periplasmic adaptor subunit [Prosthecobacter sp.]MDZ4405636.1 efflux RND transporter periplasmic adaptor subunit [Prosthecobacter sp.]